MNSHAEEGGGDHPEGACAELREDEHSRKSLRVCLTAIVYRDLPFKLLLVSQFAYFEFA